MTKIIAIVSEKGGAGKTTTAVHLGQMAESAGLATVIFDLDPRSNAEFWGDARKGKPPDVRGVKLARLPIFLEQARGQADWVILDTPGNALDVTEQACTHADLVLIPCRPAGPDLVSIPLTVKKALASGKPSFVLINAAKPQGPEVSETRTAVEGEGVRVCPVVLGDRKDFYRGFHMGLTAAEIDPKCKATEETHALFLWVRATVGEGCS